ncbi:MAG: GyrI-like domain-containing protein [Flavobacteriales bacterium]|nr:GyrI-like domain-containing protein [Flavobacteriales bacterium]
MITPPELASTTEQATASIHLVIAAREMGKYMDPAIQEIIKVITEQGVSITGPMFSYHHRRPSDTFEFEIGFPVSKDVKEEGRVKNSTLPAVKVARAVYQGPYEQLGEAWGELQSWVRKLKFSESGRFYECYLNNPDEVNDPKDYRTELNWVIG